MLLGTGNVNRNAVAYAATTLASSMMNSVFFFYYVKLFIDHYKLKEDWFQFAQVSSDTGTGRQLVIIKLFV